MNGVHAIMAQKCKAYLTKNKHPETARQGVKLKCAVLVYYTVVLYIQYMPEGHVPPSVTIRRFASRCFTSFGQPSKKPRSMQRHSITMPTSSSFMCSFYLQTAGRRYMSDLLWTIGLTQTIERNTTMTVGLGVGLGLGAPPILLIGVRLGMTAMEQRRSAAAERAVPDQGTSYDSQSHPPFYDDAKAKFDCPNYYGFIPPEAYSHVAYEAMLYEVPGDGIMRDQSSLLSRQLRWDNQNVNTLHDHVLMAPRSCITADDGQVPPK
nr:hypothetical protein CFP56_11930 [Quercus suber]